MLWQPLWSRFPRDMSSRKRSVPKFGVMLVRLATLPARPIVPIFPTSRAPRRTKQRVRLLLRTWELSADKALTFSS